MHHGPAKGMHPTASDLSSQVPSSSSAIPPCPLRAWEEGYPLLFKLYLVGDLLTALTNVMQSLEQGRESSFGLFAVTGPFLTVTSQKAFVRSYRNLFL